MQHREKDCAVQAESAIEGAQRRLEAYVDSLDMEQLAFEAAEQRLRTLQRLLAQAECRTAEELHATAESAQAALDQASQLAGASLCLCLQCL